MLLELAEVCGLPARTAAMFAGERINRTEDRSVLHVALRMPKGERLEVDGVDVVAQVHAVLDRMAAFADRVRGGQWTGPSGKRIRNRSEERRVGNEGVRTCRTRRSPVH